MSIKPSLQGIHKKLRPFYRDFIIDVIVVLAAHQTERVLSAIFEIVGA